MNKNDFKIAFTYVGAVVGAGFASGQELVRFFAVFENFGLWGALLAGVIFAILGALVIILVNNIKAEDYGKLLQTILPLKLHKTVDILIAISLWAGLGIMLIGSSTLIKEQLNISEYLGFIATAVGVYCCLWLGSKGLLNANAILVPFLIILAIGCSITYILLPKICLQESIYIKSFLPNWWVASLAYVAYNMILGIVVIASLGDDNSKISPWGGLIGGVFLGVMAWIMVKGLLLLPGNLIIAEMPMLVMAASVHPLISKIYGIGLWIALFTTALANAHSLATRISNILQRSYKKVLAVVIGSTLCFIPCKFSVLIAFIYPILGYLGLPIIILIIIATIKK